MWFHITQEFLLSSQFPTRGMRSMGSALSTLKDPCVVRSSKNLHCSGHPPTWRVDLHSFYISVLNIPHVSGWHEIITIKWQLYALTTYWTQSRLLFDHPLHTPYIHKSCFLQVSASPISKVCSQIVKHPSFVCLNNLFLFQLSHSQPLLWSWIASMWQKGKLPWYQKCPELM